MNGRVIGSHDKHGDFHLPFNPSFNTPGEIRLTPDLGADDEPTVTVRIEIASDGFWESELDFGAFHVKINDAAGVFSGSVILTREEALILASELTEAVRPVQAEA